MEKSSKMAFSSLRSLLRADQVITDVSIHDIRFPTSLEAHGSDAMHKDPDYSAAYVIISVSGLSAQGHGHTFTVGRGNEIVCAAIQAILPLVLNKSLLEVYTQFGQFWRSLTQETQLRWIGPEKGVSHLAVAAIINGLWDLWGKIEGKSVWRLLCDLTPEEIMSLVDWQYLSDAMTEQEALDVLSSLYPTRGERIEELKKNGYPAYITSVGWLGYSEERIKKLCHEALAKGFKRFKMKVGQDTDDDLRRGKIIREIVGYDCPLMTDANQRWDVAQTVEAMKKLADIKPLFIEEPTSPDDIMGHAQIARELKPLGIGVATGEMCHNRVMFKQFLKAGGMDFCQIDSCRVGGVNELITIILLARKFNVPVCPHAGGVGLCEYVQHLSAFDYICVSGDKTGRMIEFADHLHEHFVTPVVVKDGSYWIPDTPGYSGEMKKDALTKYSYPDGPVWQEMRKNNK